MAPQGHCYGPGPQAPAGLQQVAILEGRQLNGHRAGANSPEGHLPTANGHSTSTALVLHQGASQPESQLGSARAAARSPAPIAGSALAVMPDRHAICMREEAEVSAKLRDLVIAAEGYRVSNPTHQADTTACSCS